MSNEIIEFCYGLAFAIIVCTVLDAVHYDIIQPLWRVIMSKLKDILSKKKAQDVVQEQPKDEKVNLGKYNRAWASRVALYQGFELSDNDKKVDGILAALNRRDGQCPCGGNGSQFKCPCIIMRTKGICKCGLYKTIEDRKVTSTSSSAKIKVNED